MTDDHTDVLKRARERDPAIGEIVEELLGCQWGRQIGSAEDSTPCPEQAVQIVVLHRTNEQFHVKLCEHHRDIVTALTDPHND